MGNKTTIFWLAVLLLPVACKKKTTEDPVDFKYDYSPIQVGHYCIYDVVNIEHDDAVGKHDTTHYQLKEKIESTFTDEQGRPSLRLERSKKIGTGPWVVTDIWYSTRTTTQYEKVEEDERFVRLAFPVSTNTKWNGNVYNQEGEWDYIFKDEGVARTYNGLHFAETAQVVQRDEYNYVQRQLCTEVYAKYIGLVQKHFKDIDITGFDTTLAIKGEELYMTITGYGVE